MLSYFLVFLEGKRGAMSDRAQRVTVYGMVWSRLLYNTVGTGVFAWLLLGKHIVRISRLCCSSNQFRQSLTHDLVISWSLSAMCNRFIT